MTLVRTAEMIDEDMLVGKLREHKTRIVEGQSSAKTYRFAIPASARLLFDVGKEKKLYFESNDELVTKKVRSLTIKYLRMRRTNCFDFESSRTLLRELEFVRDYCLLRVKKSSILVHMIEQLSKLPFPNYDDMSK